MRKWGYTGRFPWRRRPADKRAELAGQIEAAERRLRATHESLVHLDATLRLFDPSFRPERVKARRPPSVLPVIPGLYRYVLDALRMAPEPLSSREMARAVMERLAVPSSSLEAVDKAVSVYVRRQEGRLLERMGDGRPARWRVRAEVE